MATQPKFLQRAAAANYVQTVWGLRCSKRYLANLAVTGGDPLFHKSGRDPVYDPADLEAWAKSRISPAAETSTEHRVIAIMHGHAA